MTWLRLAVLSIALAGCAERENRAELFASYQAHMQTKGFLRTETVARDIPFTNAQLAENFRRIAFFSFPNDEEHVPKPLTRWAEPIRYAVTGNLASVQEVAPLMQRLSRLTGLEITPAPETEANFVIMVLDEAGQDAALAALDDRGTEAFLEEFMEEIFDCGAVTFWADDDPTIRKALIYLHGDLTGLYRTLCYHEEIAQSLGLFNDDPTVRPSIFNDDDEFALLTNHDEYLIRILYDPRLRPGMMAQQAMPIVRQIIRDLRPE